MFHGSDDLMTGLLGATAECDVYGRCGSSMCALASDRRSTITNSSSSSRDCGSSLSTSPRALPDLTQRLIRDGTYEEYKHWRDGYFRWRKGRPDGAKGDLNATRFVKPKEVGTELDTPRYPSYGKFLFRRSLAYWAACFLTEGAIVYTLSYTGQWIQADGITRFPPTVTQWPNAIGSVWFIASSYCGFVQQLNLELEPGHNNVRLWAFPWQCSRSHGMIGWQSLLYGATCFAFGIIFGCLTQQLDDCPELRLLVWVPLTCGGVFFVVSSLMCVLENWDEPRWSCVKICTVVDMFSALAYFIGSVIPLMNPLTPEIVLFGSAGPFLIGSLGYIVTGICSITMWKNEMFGLMLSHILNEATVSTRDPSPLSVNTVIVNVIYIAAAAVATFNCCVALSLAPLVASLTEVLASCYHMIMVHLLLTLTSLVPRLPKAQPYRMLMLAVRALSVLLVVTVVTNFCDLMSRY